MERIYSFQTEPLTLESLRQGFNEIINDLYQRLEKLEQSSAPLDTSGTVPGPLPPSSASPASFQESTPTLPTSGGGTSTMEHMPMTRTPDRPTSSGSSGSQEEEETPGRTAPSSAVATDKGPGDAPEQQLRHLPTTHSYVTEGQKNQDAYDGSIGNTQRSPAPDWTPLSLANTEEEKG